jgi:hypothetical protein
MTNPSNLQRRLLFIIHRALVEIRLLAQAGRTQQAFSLADALEPLPGWLVAWRDEYLEEVHSNLETYASKYPDAFDYISFIDKHKPPASF